MEVTNERNLEKLIQGSFNQETPETGTHDSVNNDNDTSVAIERFTQGMQDHDHAFFLDSFALGVHATEG